MVGLLSRLISGLRRSARQSGGGPVAIEDRKIFAFGDLHGRFDMLSVAMAGVRARSAGETRTPILVFLGDYVDRGPQSRQIIELLCQIRAADPSARFLMGNHEEAMLRFLDDLEVGLAWPRFGGVATMESYGVSMPANPDSMEEWRAVQAALREAMPESHVRFLRGLEAKVDIGDYLFVHAGIDPERALEEQRVRDLLWIREPFLSHTANHGKVVVHGHTPTTTPHIDGRRIGIDTGAYRGGPLTVLELHGAERSVWQVVDQGDGLAFQAWTHDPQAPPPERLDGKGPGRAASGGGRRRGQRELAA